jgi:hypothetical protein
MQDEFAYLQMLGFFHSEGTTILAILGMGTIYLLTPVLGYEPTRRRPIAAAMWAMVFKIGIGLFRSSLGLLNAMGGNFAPGPGPRPPRVTSQPFFADIEQLIGILLAVSEPLVFLAAMVLFVYGLQRLRRREQVYRPPAVDGPTRVG